MERRRNADAISPIPTVAAHVVNRREGPLADDLVKICSVVGWTASNTGPRAIKSNSRYRPASVITECPNNLSVVPADWLMAKIAFFDTDAPGLIAERLAGSCRGWCRVRARLVGASQRLVRALQSAFPSSSCRPRTRQAVQPLHVVGERHEAPFEPHVGDAAQQKLAEAEHLLDDACHSRACLSRP